jgi:hypothetical protein
VQIFSIFGRPDKHICIVNYTAAEQISVRTTGMQLNGNAMAKNVNKIGKDTHDVVITVRGGHGEARGPRTARLSSSRFLGWRWGGDTSEKYG